MKVLELFSGTGHISNAFRKRGHKARKVDWSHDLDANLHTDISTMTAEDIKKLCHGRPGVIWASPDCTTYSVAACHIHRDKECKPKTDYAKFCDMTDQHVIDLIAELKPKVWFIENPRGIMRKMSWMVNLADKLPGAKRYTITYCQYGATNMKPTDIWTNHPDPKFLPPCKNGMSCHESSPRGSNKGAIGKFCNHITGNAMYPRAIVRGLMPDKLIEHIVDICEEET
jgi:hypothetical protein